MVILPVFSIEGFKTFLFGGSPSRERLIAVLAIVLILQIWERIEVVLVICGSDDSTFRLKSLLKADNLYLVLGCQRQEFGFGLNLGFFLNVLT